MRHFRSARSAAHRCMRGCSERSFRSSWGWPSLSSWLIHLVTIYVGDSAAAILSALTAVVAMLLAGLLCGRIARRVGGQIERAEEALRAPRKNSRPESRSVRASFSRPRSCSRSGTGSCNSRPPSSRPPRPRSARRTSSSRTRTMS